MPPAALLLAALTLPAARAQAWPSVSSPPLSNKDGAHDAALVIAIEDYVFAQDIPGAAQNGRDWAAWLSQGRGVKTVKVLENGAATKEEILLAARGVGERVGPGGRLWVIYVGHGAPSSDGAGGMLVGVDAQQTAVSLEARSVRLQELEAALGDRAAEVVLVQDACFSGKGSGGDLAPGLAWLREVAGLDAGPQSPSDRSSSSSTG